MEATSDRFDWAQLLEWIGHLTLVYDFSVGWER